MTKYNKANTLKSTKNAPDTLNKAGGQAYSESTKLKVASILLTSFMNDQYYRSGGAGEKELSAAISELKDKKFAAKAAIYARNKFGMRSVSHYTAAEIAASVKGENWTRNFFREVIFRADDATEIAAAYFSKYGKPFPNSLKRGIADKLETFDAYQIAKYKGSDRGISMIDLVNLTHPKRTEPIDSLMKGTLAPAETWEVALSQAGQNANEEVSVDDLKGEAWASLLNSNKLGYFALLRNLRNISEQAPKVLDLALEKLVDPVAIKKSKVFPFRFVTAYNQFTKTSGSQKILKALSKAATISVSNVPDFKGTTLVALDESGSMGGDGEKEPFFIGSVLAAALISKGADFIGFSSNAAYRSFSGMDLISDIKAIQKTRVNGGTNFKDIFIKANRPYDRIIILSDMQAWMGYYTPDREFMTYKKNYKADPRIYSFDLAGYGTIQFPENKIYPIAGFSDKVFDLMELLEKGDRQALINEIDKIEL